MRRGISANIGWNSLVLLCCRSRIWLGMPINFLASFAPGGLSNIVEGNLKGNYREIVIGTCI